MLQEAITKLQTEMEQNKSNGYIQLVGDYLIKFLGTNPEAAEKILVEDKTINKSLDHMRKVAEKKMTGNYAMLTPEEGFKAILEYFVIKSEVVIEAPVPPKLENVPAASKAVDFDIKLDDLL